MLYYDGAHAMRLSRLHDLARLSLCRSFCASCCSAIWLITRAKFVIGDCMLPRSLPRRTSLDGMVAITPAYPLHRSKYPSTTPPLDLKLVSFL